MPRAVFFLAALLLGLGPARADLAAERQAELRYLLKHDCGSCHGMTRKGGLGAPLLPTALADRSDDLLAAIILDGLPGTPMPPWRGILDGDDARWLVRTLRTGGDPR